MTIVLRKDPVRRCLVLDAWPEADRAAWSEAITPGDIFDPGGLAAGWATGTQRKVAAAYGRWLTWLDRAALLDCCETPGGRATPESVLAYVRHLQTLNAPLTVLGRVEDLHRALKVTSPQIDWRWIARIGARLRWTVKPVKEKRPLMIPSRDLFDRGLRMMDEADAGADSDPGAAAIKYRDGLMIALLISRPLRLNNFATLKIEQHLVRRHDVYWIHISRTETKNKQPIEVPVPTELTPRLARYMAHHRVRLLDRPYGQGRGTRQTGQVLWITNSRFAMTGPALYHIIKQRIGAEFGCHLTPHLFRDCAATSIATEDPEHVHITKSILGHTTLAMSERHYNHAKSLEAAKLFQNGILALRQRRRDTSTDSRWAT
jgi:integrase/recombinase XerD